MDAPRASISEIADRIYRVESGTVEEVPVARPEASFAVRPGASPPGR